MRLFYRFIVYGAGEEMWNYDIIDEDKHFLYVLHDGDVLPIPKLLLWFMIQFRSNLVDDIIKSLIKEC